MSMGERQINALVDRINMQAAKIDMLERENEQLRELLAQMKVQLNRKHPEDTLSRRMKSD